jgi:hypothetical protein
MGDQDAGDSAMMAVNKAIAEHLKGERWTPEERTAINLFLKKKIELGNKDVKTGDLPPGLFADFENIVKRHTEPEISKEMRRQLATMIRG